MEISVYKGGGMCLIFNHIRQQSPKSKKATSDAFPR